MIHTLPFVGNNKGVVTGEMEIADGEDINMLDALLMLLHILCKHAHIEVGAPIFSHFQFSPLSSLISSLSE